MSRRGRPALPGAAGLAALCLAATPLVGCEDEVPEFEAPVVDRCASGVGTPDGAWASGPWPGRIEVPETEGLVEIPPQSGITLLHGLGRAPVEVHCYVGFSEAPARIMPGTGNACEIHELGLDEASGCHSVVVRNGSGGSFFYRFVMR